MSSKKDCENLDQLVREEETDEKLMEAVARCLSDEVRRFAMARCGDKGGDADDISQDAMLAAQRYLSTFRGEASLRTWLYRLVLSACSHRRRGQKNDPNIHKPLDDAGEGADPSDPEVVLLMSERLGALEEAMNDLRPEDRDLLAAAEWEDRPLKDVADQRGLTVPAVKSRLFRIRRQLKENVAQRFEKKAAGLAPSDP